MTEPLLTKLFTIKLCEIYGSNVYRSVRVGGLEIDVLLFEPGEGRPHVHIYEVKARAKPELVRQVEERMAISDYMYIVVPYRLYPWALRRVRDEVGVIVYLDDFYVMRRAKNLGNGVNMLRLWGTPMVRQAFKPCLEWGVSEQMMRDSNAAELW